MNQTSVITRLQAMHRPRTERPNSCCVQCGIVWPCPTSRVLDEAEPAVLPEPPDRAAVLLDAANLVDAVRDRLSAKPEQYLAGLERGARELRRLAAEAQQQPETEAHPAEHSWAAELHDPLADEWVPGTRYPVRDRAVNALEHGSRIGPTWKDGTPTRRRLVRATTTYTVEEPAPVAHQPVAHTGGNAEDCPACIAGGLEKLGYPWDCPGPEQQAAADDGEDTQRCPAEHGALGRICDLSDGHPGMHTGSGPFGGAVWEGDAP